MAHPLILFVSNPYPLRLLNLFTAPGRARAGVIAAILFVLPLISSVWRKVLKISYPSWRVAYNMFAVVAAALALYHATIKDFRPGEVVYVDSPFGTFDT